MNAIKEKLNKILLKRSGHNFAGNSALYHKKLLGLQICMPARELLHVYFDVEQEFGISIPEEEIVAGNFDTAEHIAEIIERQLSHAVSNY